MFKHTDNSDVRRKRSKKWIIMLSSILTLVCLYFLGNLIYYQFFFDIAEREFLIPALEDGFVPQGLDYCEEYNLFFVSGYMCSGGQAKICVVYPDNEYRVVSVLDEKEKALVSHAGGICHSNNFVYIAGGDGKCYVISLSELVQDGATSIHTMGSFAVHNRASFCCVKDNQLFVGEYYNRIKYGTDDSHHFITPGGEENRAVVTAFSLDATSSLGVCDIPEMALSIPGRIQGISFIDDNKLVLSASSVFRGSQLYVYDYEMALADNKDVFSVNGNEIPIFFCDSVSFLDSIEVLPKVEGITVCEDRLFMVFESACKIYRYGKLLESEYAHSIPMGMLMGR